MTNGSLVRIRAAVLAFTFGVGLGVQASAVQSSNATFDVVSVRENTGPDTSIRFDPQPPDGFQRANLPLASYVTYAWGIRQPSRVAGMPDWAHSTRYDIVAKASALITEAQRQLMMRNALATRFQLRTHFESREQTVYVMTFARADKRLGPGLTLRTNCATEPCTSSGTGRPDGLIMRGTTLTQLADGMLSNLRGQVVRDETELDGVYDVTMSWRPDAVAPDSSDSRPSFFTAMQEQLGLKLEPQKRAVEVLVIDRLERPMPN